MIVRNAATRVAVGYKFAKIGCLVTISYHFLLVLSSVQFGIAYLYSFSFTGMSSLCMDR